MRKNELVNGFIAAICIVIVVFAFVGIIMLNYSVNMRRKLYETSSDKVIDLFSFELLTSIDIKQFFFVL